MDITHSYLLLLSLKSADVDIQNEVVSEVLLLSTAVQKTKVKAKIYVVCSSVAEGVLCVSGVAHHNTPFQLRMF